MTTKKELQEQIDTLWNLVARHRITADSRQEWADRSGKSAIERHKHLLAYIDLILEHLGLEIKNVEEVPSHLEIVKKEKK